MAAPKAPMAKARQQGLVVRELPDEVLVYDLERHKAHCLSRLAAAVWRGCDGKASAREIAERLRKDVEPALDPDLVLVAVKRLSRARLLEEPVRLAGIASSLPRREMLRRVAAVGGLSVLSITVPTAAYAITCVSCVTCESTKNSACTGRPCCDGPSAGALCLSGGGGKCCTCGGGGKTQCGGAC